VFKGFKPTFEALGEVTVIADPVSEVPALVASSKARNQAVYCIIFAPPNKSFVDLPCPTYTVFAWEFDTLPNESWDDDPMNDWVSVLRQQQGAITLASYSSGTVHKALGADFPVFTVPVPVPSRDIQHEIKNTISIRGSLIDSHNYALENGEFIVRNVHRMIESKSWDRSEPIEMQFLKGNPECAYLGGFYCPEDWGLWSQTRSPWIIIPHDIVGDIEVRIYATGHGRCTGRYDVELGSERQSMYLTNDFEWHILRFSPTKGDKVLKIIDLLPNPPSSGDDPRHIGMGLKALEIHNSTLPLCSAGDSVEENPEYGFDAAYTGFQPMENWGIWSAESQCHVEFDRKFRGKLKLEMTLAAFGYNIGRDILVQLGDEMRTITLSEQASHFEFDLTVRDASARLRFSNIDTRVKNPEQEPRSLGIGIHGIRITVDNETSECAAVETHFELALSEPESDAALGGFHACEHWGRWSRSDVAWCKLPPGLVNGIDIEFEAQAFGENIGRPIEVSLGQDKTTIYPGALLQQFTLSAENSGNGVLSFSGMDTNSRESDNGRNLGLGVSYVKATSKLRTDSLKTLHLNGSEAVYITVFNPEDGRKNWEDIVTAFTYAFIDNPDAVLILKITHHEVSSFLGELHFLLHHMAPFKCRIIALHGYLPSEAYNQLINTSDYYVNASHAEGLCLPLLEALRDGIPAISPDHTAMADFVSKDNAFILRYSREPTIWPHDQRRLFRAHRFRIDWQSLVEAYQQSFADRNTKKYIEMQEHGKNAVEAFCGNTAVLQKLAAVFEETNDAG
jgi:hypothetical protein